MYILGIELKGNEAFLALVDKLGKNRFQCRTSLGDREDSSQVATFHRVVCSFIERHDITSVKLTRTDKVLENANALDIIKMETIFQLLFPQTLSIIDRETLEFWLAHHYISHQLMNNYHHAAGAAQYEQTTNICII